ncbi:MAG: Hsp20 family protein [Chitinivibrionales bacterium]|nr:Hsp20 family protein [Chitinivibrionales bacterium]
MTAELEKRGKHEVANTAAEQVRESGRAYVPDVDVYVSEDELVLVADMPGVEKGNVTLEVTESDTLVIQGKCTMCDDERRALVRQYNIGDYYRSFQVGDEFDRERIDVKLANGVLEVRVPKREEAKPRRIQISA